MDAEEVREKLISGFTHELLKAGISEKYLAQKLKRELNAKISERVKVKGSVKKEDLPRGRRIVTESGTIAYDKEGKLIGGDGDTVIEWSEKAWDIQQRARMDAHKLFGHYPAAQVHVGGEMSVTLSLDEDEKAIMMAMVEQTKRKIMEDHLKEIESGDTD